jgi:hypothetical protein
MVLIQGEGRRGWERDKTKISNENSEKNIEP